MVRAALSPGAVAAVDSCGLEAQEAFSEAHPQCQCVFVLPRQLFSDSRYLSLFLCLDTFAVIILNC